MALREAVDEAEILLEPSYLALRAVALSQAVVGIDESEWRLLDKGRQKWLVWCLRGDGVVFYQVRQTKKADDVRALLEGFEGWAVSDGARASLNDNPMDLSQRYQLNTL